MKQEPNSEAAETVQTKEIPAVAPAATCSRFVARMVACMEVQNAKNTATPECAEWVKGNRKEAVKAAINSITSGFGFLIIAEVNPEEILGKWMDAVERSNSDASNAEVSDRPS